MLDAAPAPDRQAAGDAAGWVGEIEKKKQVSRKKALPGVYPPPLHAYPTLRTPSRCSLSRHSLTAFCCAHSHVQNHVRKQAPGSGNGIQGAQASRQTHCGCRPSERASHRSECSSDSAYCGCRKNLAILGAWIVVVRMTPYVLDALQ